MDNQFTEAWYSPEGKEIVLFLCKEPPKRIALWDRENSQWRFSRLRMFKISRFFTKTAAT